MSLNWNQFEHGVLRVVLTGPFGWERQVGKSLVGAEAAVRLVGETIWHESDQLKALGQYSVDLTFGPGLGPCSMERPTWDWLVRDHIQQKVKLRDFFQRWSIGDPGNYDQFAYNLALNVAACRLRYWVDSRMMPGNTFDIESRSKYWFAVYNASGVEARRHKYIKDAKLIAWG